MGRNPKILNHLVNFIGLSRPNKRLQATLRAPEPYTLGIKRMNELPQGSNINIEIEDTHQEIVIPHKSGGVFRIFIALFLLVWLGVWATGWVSAASSLIKGDDTPRAFLLFWLCGWTFGGIFAIYFFYRLVRSSVPESLVLSTPNLLHDTGIAPFQMSFGFKSQSEMWRQMFSKRKLTEFTYEELRSLNLREYSEGNRLTIDKGNKRIELATGATEFEREWLFKRLSTKYS